MSAQFNLAVVAAGSEIVIRGFVFPVGDPHSFGDSFGAPRMMGTGYEHAHQGTDILAPAGTPLLACERGIITRMGSDVLGGTKIWVKGESGTYYYYAHRSEEHTSELQSLMRISYAVFCLKKKTPTTK